MTPPQKMPALFDHIKGSRRAQVRCHERELIVGRRPGAVRQAIPAQLLGFRHIQGDPQLAFTGDNQRLQAKNRIQGLPDHIQDPGHHAGNHNAGEFLPFFSQKVQLFRQPDRIVRRVPGAVCVQLGGKIHTVFIAVTDFNAAEGNRGIANVNYQYHTIFPCWKAHPGETPWAAGFIIPGFFPIGNTLLQILPIFGILVINQVQEG